MSVSSLGHNGMLDAIANESIAVSKRRFGLLPAHANSGKYRMRMRLFYSFDDGSPVSTFSRERWREREENETAKRTRRLGYRL